MARTFLLAFLWIQVVLCATSTAAEETGFLEVVEVVIYDEDPAYVFVRDWTQSQLRLFEHEKTVAIYNNDKSSRETAKAKISGMKNFVGKLRTKIKKGMTEIRGWDGIKKEPIVIQCRSDKTRSVAKRYRQGDFISFTMNSSYKTVALRTVSRIDWRRGRKNGVMSNIPRVRDKLEWHWSIDGWSNEYVIKGLLETADKSIKYVYSSLGFSKPRAKLTPTVLEAVTLRKSKKALHGWGFVPKRHVYPWTTKQDLNSTVTASLKKCVFDGRTTHCVVLDGDIEDVYSVVVHIYGYYDGDGRRKRLSQSRGFFIGGAAGGIFGSALGKHVKEATEFPVTQESFVRFSVEVVELTRYKK